MICFRVHLAAVLLFFFSGFGAAPAARSLKRQTNFPAEDTKDKIFQKTFETGCSVLPRLTEVPSGAAVETSGVVTVGMLPLLGLMLVIGDSRRRMVVIGALITVGAAALLVFGGPALHYFALALTIGICFGIYSSVLVMALTPASQLTGTGQGD